MLANQLDDDERRRASEFVLARDRNAYVAAHGVLRMALSRVGTGHPADWRFERTATGRPVLAGSSLAFSLTHARTLVACAVARAGPIGIDAEAIPEHEPEATLLEATCTPAEAASIRALAAPLRARAFTLLWTRKEAAAKALDLARNFQPQAFAFDADGALRAPNAAGELTFGNVSTDERHVLTVACPAGAAASASARYSHVDDEWVTFGLTRRDA